METRIETIDPELAAEYLNYNISRNRKVLPGHVQFLAEEIRNGYWELNGESIKFAKSPKRGLTLIDGQHRLEAIILAGKPIETVVIEGVSTKTFATLDTGKNRNVNTILQIQGEGNANVLASALRFLGRYKMTPNLGARHLSQSNKTLVELYSDHKGIKKHIKIAPKMNRIAPGGFCVFLQYVLASSGYKKEAEDFMYKMSTGVGLELTSPVLHYREANFTEKAKGYRVTRANRLNRVIATWNAYIEGKRVKEVPFSAKFPLIHGVDRVSLFNLNPQEVAIQEAQTTESGVVLNVKDPVTGVAQKIELSGTKVKKSKSKRITMGAALPGA